MQSNSNGSSFFITMECKAALAPGLDNTGTLVIGYFFAECPSQSGTDGYHFSLTFRRQKLASLFPIEQVRCRLSIALVLLSQRPRRGRS
jgi:hypothetical protein